MSQPEHHRVCASVSHDLQFPLLRFSQGWAQSYVVILTVFSLRETDWTTAAPVSRLALRQRRAGAPQARPWSVCDYIISDMSSKQHRSLKCIIPELKWRHWYWFECGSTG